MLRVVTMVSSDRSSLRHVVAFVSPASPLLESVGHEARRHDRSRHGLVPGRRDRGCHRLRRRRDGRRVSRYRVAPHRWPRLVLHPAARLHLLRRARRAGRRPHERRPRDARSRRGFRRSDSPTPAPPAAPRLRRHRARDLRDHGRGAGGCVVARDLRQGRPHLEPAPPSAPPGGRRRGDRPALRRRRPARPRRARQRVALAGRDAGRAGGSRPSRPLHSRPLHDAVPRPHAGPLPVSRRPPGPGCPRRRRAGRGAVGAHARVSAVPRRHMAHGRHAAGPPAFTVAFVTMEFVWMGWAVGRPWATERVLAALPLVLVTGALSGWVGWVLGGFLRAVGSASGAVAEFGSRWRVRVAAIVAIVLALVGLAATYRPQRFGPPMLVDELKLVPLSTFPYQEAIFLNVVLAEGWPFAPRIDARSEGIIDGLPVPVGPAWCAPTDAALATAVAGARFGVEVNGTPVGLAPYPLVRLRLRDGSHCAWVGVASAFQRASQNRFVYTIERPALGVPLTTRVELGVTFKDP